MLVAATLAVPACGGSPHVNDRPPDSVNVPPDNKPVDSPINDRAKDPGPTSPEQPDGPNVNTPEPQPEGKHINTPEPLPDVNRPKPQTPKDIPPPGQTINRVQSPPKNAPPAPVEVHVNTPPPSK